MNRSRAAGVAWASSVGRVTTATALMLCMLGLLAGCGASSRSISIIGPSIPELVSISVTPSDSTLATGLTHQFTATGAYSDGTNANISSSVTWTSKVPNVAVISNTLGSAGVATAVSVGDTTITATLGGITGSTTLTVTGFTLASIAVTPASQTIPNQTPLQYTATGVYSNNTEQNLTTLVDWTSSNPSVASVSNTTASIGLANTLAPGTTSITATLGSISGSTPLTVTSATLVSIAITPANSSLTSGSTEQLTATGTYSDGTKQNLTPYASWSSSNVSLASVSNAAGSQGLATAVSQGVVTITATFGGITGTTGLTIAAVTLQSISIAPQPASAAAGTNLQFTATGHYNNGSTQSITTLVTWFSSNASIATINNQGYASALVAGSTTIMASLSGISDSVPFTVTHGNLLSIVVTPAKAVISIGQTQQYVATGTYADGFKGPITAGVSWLSSLPFATIGQTGIATGVSLGPTQISATVGNITSAPVPLTVTAAFAYALNFDNGDNGGNGSITPYQILPGGQLSVLTPNSYTTGNKPYSLAVDPTDSYAYVANYESGGEGTVEEYAIGANGGLTPLPGNPTISTADGPTPGNGPNSIAVNPNGLYAYVVNYNSGTITEYTITNGALAFLTTQSTGTNSYPASIALTSTGTYAYVAGGYFNTGPGTVYEYQVVNGALQPLTASPTIATGDEPNEIVVDPLNRFAWVVNYFDGTVSAYTIGTNGALQLTGTVSADANSNSRCGGNGCAASSITIDATGQNAYVTNRSAGTIWQYAINQTNGTLTKLNIVNVGTGTEPSWLAIDPSGQYAYVTERVAGGSTIAEYSITGGALTPLPQATVQSSGTEPVSIFTAR